MPGLGLGRSIYTMSPPEVERFIRVYDPLSSFLARHCHYPKPNHPLGLLHRKRHIPSLRNLDKAGTTIPVPSRIRGRVPDQELLQIHNRRHYHLGRGFHHIALDSLLPYCYLLGLFYPGRSLLGL